MIQIPEPAKWGFDLLAIAAWASALLQVLTNATAWAAAAASLVWGLIRIYETKTVQAYLTKRKQK